ncbi:hypothetical protein RB596_000918 [Gaeumannomyces avenae]
MCIDYRPLNEATIKDRYPLPFIDELRDKLGKAKYFTALDLRKAYGLLRIKEGQEWMTAFRTRMGVFESMVMTFGLTNAPATFQRMIEHVLREHLDIFVLAYLDDILIFSETLEEHKQHVHQVLQKLQDAKLLANPDKCVWHTQRVVFLGFVITPGEVRMDPKKVQQVLEWPVPTNVKEVRGFLGFLNFYRRFIRDFSKKAAPLTNFTKNNVPFYWGEREQEAFELLREAVTQEPVLVIPDPERPFEVETDASDYAIGGQLGQRDDQGRLHPCAFFSHKLDDTQINYQVHDKELLAVIQALDKWKAYLRGANHQVVIYTDHKNLTHFTTSQKLNKRQTRWSEFLQDYDIRIEYRKGSENGKADALSRRPDYETEAPKETYVLLARKPDGSLVPAQKVLARTDIQEEWTPGRIQQIHGQMANGHQGTTKTWKKLRQHHGFTGTRAQVQEAIKDCEECAKNKASRHRPYGLLQPLPAPSEAWQEVTMDFVVKLPKSKEPLTNVHYDSILVIMDRLTKYAYFLPYKEASNATELAYAFIKHVIANHGTPARFITDRDKLFKSRFWRTLVARMGAEHALSTAYHPETDGQTKRTNQTIEQYLRNYVNYKQNNWVQLLPMAQFAYNSSIHESTGVTPYFANYGYTPTAYREPKAGKDAPAAEIQVKELTKLHTHLQAKLDKLRTRMSAQANKKRIEGPTFKEGDSVYLSRREQGKPSTFGIKTKKPSDKLDYKKLKPFKVLKKISNVNYELQLPPTMHNHPVFHVSLLEPAPPGRETNELVEVDPKQEYEVESILEDSVIDGIKHYLVKWAGFGNEENTWEPESNLGNATALLAKYRRKVLQGEATSAPEMGLRLGTPAPE